MLAMLAKIPPDDLRLYAPCMMLLCELLQLLYYFYFFSSLCNFDPICNIVIYFLLVLNFATVICVLSINGKKNDFKETDF